MTTETHDYGEFKEAPEVGGNLMSALTGLADEQQAAEEEVLRLETLLDEAKKNLKRISEFEIPNLLDGLEGKIALPDGRTVTVAEKIRASLDSDKKPLAMRWLDDNGHGGLIKRKFTIEFNRDQEEWAKKFEEQLAQSETPLNVKKEHMVHWQTLDAFVREQLETGAEIPLDLIGVFRQRNTKIK